MGRARVLLAFLLVSCLAAAAQAKTFVYIHDSSTPGDPNTPQVFGFSWKRGILTPVPGSPFAVPDDAGTCGGECQTIDYSKKRKTLVVGGASGLTSFLVNPDGSLTATAGSPVGGTTELDGTATVQVGKRVFAYGGEFSTGMLHGFEVGVGGALTELPSSPFDVGLTEPTGIAARKNLLFAVDEDLGTIGSYVIGPDGTPTPAPGSPVTPTPEPAFIYNVGPDAKGKLVYALDGPTDTLPAKVYGFTVDKHTAELTPIPGSPFETNFLLEVEQVVAATTAKGILAAIGFLEVDLDLQLFKVGKGGVLSPLGAVHDTNVNARAQASHPSGKFLVVASEDNVVVIAIQKSTGLIDHAPFVPLGAGGTNPTGIVILNR
jgi:hypothetical protein